MIILKTPKKNKMNLRQETKKLQQNRADFAIKRFEKYKNSLRYKYVKWKILKTAEHYDRVFFLWLPPEAIYYLRREGFGIYGICENETVFNITIGV